MDFLQAKSPFLGVMCIPTVAIATKYLGRLSSVVSWNSMGSYPKLKRQSQGISDFRRISDFWK